MRKTALPRDLRVRLDGFPELMADLEQLPNAHKRNVRLLSLAMVGLAFTRNTQPLAVSADTSPGAETGDAGECPTVMSSLVGSLSRSL